MWIVERETRVSGQDFLEVEGEISSAERGGVFIGESGICLRPPVALMVNWVGGFYVQVVN